MKGLAPTRFGLAGLSVRLLAGLVTTVVVAWGLVAVVDPADGSNRFVADSRARRPENGEGTGHVTAVALRAPGTRVYWGTAHPIHLEMTGQPGLLVPGWARARVLPWLHGAPWPGDGAGEDRILIARGWPSLAFFCEIHTGTQNPSLVSWGARLPDWNMRRNWGRVVPFRPRWPGLLADTVCYAAMWSMLFAAPGYLRRALRRRRGFCPRCGYDPKGTPQGAPCPECGNGEGHRGG